MQGKALLYTWGPFILVSLMMMAAYSVIFGGLFDDVQTGFSFRLLSDHSILMLCFLWILNIAVLLVFPIQIPKRSQFVTLILVSLIFRLIGTTLGDFAGFYHASPQTDILQFSFFDLSPGRTLLAHNLMLLTVDLGNIGLLWKICQNRSLATNWIFLYAVNPVIILSLKPDFLFPYLTLFFVLFSIYTYEYKKWNLMFIGLGVCVYLNPITAPSLLFLFNKKNLNRFWMAPVTFLIICLAIYSNIWAQFLNKFNEYEKLVFFAEEIETEFIAQITGTEIGTALNYGLLVFSLIFVLIHFHPELNSVYQRNPIPGIFYIQVAFLLFVPGSNIVYLILILPLVVLYPSLTWLIMTLILAITSHGYFTNWLNNQSTSFWIFQITWLPFYITVGSNWLINRRLDKNQNPVVFPKNVSIIIPVKNDGPNLQKCLVALSGEKDIQEIIVVEDGEICDVDIIINQPTTNLIRFDSTTEEGWGRGGQIYKGIKAARGDIIAIIHADVTITKGLISEILNVLQKDNTVIGGTVGGRYYPSHLFLKVIEIMNDFRAAMLGIGFGDQIQFFRRLSIVEKNIYPAIPLMEDIELSLRLRRFGRVVHLFKPIETSPRRWQKIGLKNGRLILNLSLRYLWQRLWKEPDTAKMYDQYYGGTSN